MRLTSSEEARDVGIEGEAASIDGRKIPFGVVRNGERIEGIRIGRDVLPVRAVRVEGGVLLWCAGRVFEFRRESGRSVRRGDAAGSLAAPMPGRVRKVMAGAGDEVSEGDVVLVLEAMKMEHAIRAPRSGTVRKIFHAEGDLVEAGAELAAIE